MGFKADVEAKVGSVEAGIWTYLEDHVLTGENVEFACRQVRALRHLIANGGQLPSAPAARLLSWDTSVPSAMPRAQAMATKDWRGAALGLYLAKRSETDRRVIAFRNDYLEGGRLGPKAAYSLLQSPAIQVLSLSQLQARGVPLLAHTARIVDAPKYEMLRDGEWKRRILRFSLEIAWSGQTATLPIERRDKVRANGKFTANPWIALPVGRNHSRPATVFSGSVLADLRDVVLSLTDGFPWSEDDTVMFVLTGEIPQMRRIRVYPTSRVTESYSDPILNIQVDATMSPRFVADAYQSARRKVFTRRVRPPSDRTRLVVEHVLASLEDLSEEIDWEKLRITWNRGYELKRKWQFKKTWRMRTAFDRGVATIVRPPVKIGTPAEDPPKENG